MSINIKPAAGEEIRSWREMYRSEMNCQIIHDSLHTRKGWPTTYTLNMGENRVGYGTVAIGGPWTGKSALFEFYVGRGWRHRSFDLFAALLEAAKPARIEAQSNDPFLTPMLLFFGRNVMSESILFRDEVATALTLRDALFRPVRGDDATKVLSTDRDPGSDWAVEIGGEIAATGGLLFHYNPPYGDVWLEVNENFRRRGVGSFIAQELKRVCYGMGRIPATRCHPQNTASRRTLQKAGFAPCGHILSAAAEG